MIDFHSHILPNIDDGAKDVETSLKMLESAKADGIDTIVSTSHIYITDEESIDKFLLRRKKAYNKLMDAISGSKDCYPKIILGSEIHIRSGIGEFKKLEELKIDGTDYILLEMPYSAWKEGHLETVYDIKARGFMPIMAHIERFYEYRDMFDDLKSIGVKFQVNADSFLEKQTRKIMYELFQNGYVHLLGSDMHNLDSRKNNLKEAYSVIEDKFGNCYSEYVKDNAKKFFTGKEITDKELPKLSFINKLKL